MINAYSKTEIDFLTRIGFKNFLRLPYSREYVFQTAIMDAFVKNDNTRDTETLRLIAEKMIKCELTWEVVESIISR